MESTFGGKFQILFKRGHFFPTWWSIGLYVFISVWIASVLCGQKSKSNCRSRSFIWVLFSLSESEKFTIVCLRLDPVNFHFLGQRRIQHPAHLACAPPVWNFLRLYFWKFWFYNTHKLYFYQHAMFTIFILCRIYVKGASKKSSDLKNYTVPGPHPPVLKFLDPPQ